METGISKKVFSIIGVVAITVGLITGLFTIDSRYVTNDRLLAFENAIDTKIETQRYQSLTDRYYQMKQLSIQHPKDDQIKEELQNIQKDRDDSGKALRKMTSPTKDK
jgi:hypothetical protein